MTRFNCCCFFYANWCILSQTMNERRTAEWSMTRSSFSRCCCDQTGSGLILLHLCVHLHMYSILSFSFEISLSALTPTIFSLWYLSWQPLSNHFISLSIFTTSQQYGANSVISEKMHKRAIFITLFICFASPFFLNFVIDADFIINAQSSVVTIRIQTFAEL